MSDPIVPRTIEGHNTWMVRTSARLIAINPATSQPYWKDYGLDTAVNTEWQSRNTTWNGLYTKHQNRHDSIDNQDLQDAIKSMASFAERPLLTIAGSPIAGNEEQFIFNFKIGHGQPTTTQQKISAQVAAEVLMGTRGITNIWCKFVHEQGDASKPHGADCVQYAYMIMDKPDTTDPSQTLITPDTVGMVKDISTHAHFHLDLGMANMGRWVAFYFRWHNTKHPDLAGPWSSVQFLAIS